MWDPQLSKWDNAADVLARNNLKPLSLAAKEGLALINGTQFITSYTAEALVRASLLAIQADIVSALSVEVLKGTNVAFDKRIHDVRPHEGQIAVAQRLRQLLQVDSHPSQIFEKYGKQKKQDAYSLRCIPQVHGIVHDTLSFVRKIITTEMNSATDNPLVFSDDNNLLSGGNFHGEYPAKAADYLGIAVAELGNISERRIERMVNHSLGGHPSFLIDESKSGLNSGFMIAQYTAAALASENKVLVHPASSDTIPTSEGQEDHVSMGGFAARKALSIVENVESILAIELLCACQAKDFIAEDMTPPLQEIYKLVRGDVRHWDKDRFMSPEITKVRNLLLSGKVWKIVQNYLDA